MNQSNFNSFVSSNISYKYPSNSNDLEDILIKNIDYENNNLYRKKKIKGSKSFIKRNNENKNENNNDLEDELNDRINNKNYHELNNELTSESNLNQIFNSKLNILLSKNNSSLIENPEYATFGKNLLEKRSYNDKYFDAKNKIIKIQSVWKGYIIRKKVFGIICMTIVYQNFFNILANILSKNIRLFVLKNMFIYSKLKKIFIKYNIYNYYFQRWKCITKLLKYKSNISNNQIIFKKRKIYMKNNKYSLLTRYFNIWKQCIIRHDIFIKLKTNRKNFISKNKINNVNLFDINQQDKNEILRKSLFIYENYQKDNLIIKRYYLYRWSNQVKNIKMYQLKKRILIYTINSITKKNEHKILKKYFAKWKLFKTLVFTKKLPKNKVINKQKKVIKTDYKNIPLNKNDEDGKNYDESVSNYKLNKIQNKSNPIKYNNINL